MLVQKLKEMFDYLRDGFYHQESNEKSLKIYLINTFSLVGIVFVIPLSLTDYVYSDTLLTFLLLSVAFILVLNIFYLKATENYLFAANAVFYMFFVLMLYLLYSGGVDNTGHLWIYCLPPIALFLHGLKKGLMELLVFLGLVSIMLYVPIGYSLDTIYTKELKIRIILSFIAVSLLAALYEYARATTARKMKKLQKDLQFFLKRDELTGLYNRRGYNDNTYKLGSSKGVVLMCDIDHFKAINDTYGHDAGDHVIQEIAKCIRETIRKDDVAVRWGGEEFLVFLANTKINHAYFVSEKLRESVENLLIRYRDHIIHVTISLGMAPVDDETNLDEAIKYADSAMYISKTTGRNKSSRY